MRPRFWKRDPDLTPEEKAREIANMKNQDIWPNWPVLPMRKRIKGGWELGLVTASHPTRLVHMSILTLNSGDLEAQVADKRATIFPSIEAMVEAGWIGD